ncbi:serine/threonine protein kinase [Streptomyces antimicrobicus]|uniref:Serine/threonine protein kinase n=1 Tax=Streptomyces antimicrobicus TaxID=2883108 RepID=A0ABS8BB82_9ACTN|nr:serine/threonine protein kinase [Streptomyces antimicrobicus]MCB5181852.1 serine/threonine protein kinase [Streptomyces antimicrobicus]
MGDTALGGGDVDDYAGRILAGRYRLPVPPTDAYELVETRAFDTRTGQEVLVRQVPLPEVVDAELVDGGRVPMPDVRDAADLPAVRRAIEAAQAAARIPDHPRLDQVFDVFAEGGSLWIVGELVPARPLAALIADRPLSPYRAAEVAADVLTALRVLHAHGWTHRNITVRTVLVCDDGRVVLTGLASGAAEDALCGYDPVPPSAAWPPAQGTATPHPSVPGAPAGAPTPLRASGRAETPARGVPLPGRTPDAAAPPPAAPPPAAPPPADRLGPGRFEAPAPEDPWPGPAADDSLLPPPRGAAEGGDEDPGSGRAGQGAGGYAPLVAPGYDTAPLPRGTGGPVYRDHVVPHREDQGSDPSRTQRSGVAAADPAAAARAGAIAAYRAGARAAAQESAQESAEAERRAAGLPAAGLPAAELPAAGLPAAELPAAGLPAAELPAPGPADAQQAREASPRGPGEGDTTAPARRAGSNLPQGYEFPYGTPRRPARAVPPLPAQPALPQGFHQAGPDPSPGTPALPDDPRPRPTGPDPAPAAAGPARDPGAQRHPAAAAPLNPQPPTGWSATPAPRPSPAPPPSPAEAPARPGRSPQAAPRPAWDAGAGTGAGAPRSPLAAERARSTRMAVVGAVTERWAPEQAAGPVRGNWQLAAPVGPATDLWALGALLFRAVQGHAPYPEDSVAELVEMVCSEPPAFAEECGPLRPVVESLLRQDPTERPDVEELRGWLRSLVRSAPEPDGGAPAVAVPEPDPGRLPVVRRRAELSHGRHRGAPAARKPRTPAALGRTLLLLVLLGLAGAVAYAMLFLPKAEPAADGAPARPGPTTTASASPPGGNTATGTPGSKPATRGDGSPAAPAPSAPPGYTTAQDPEGFQLLVPEGWDRRRINDMGQVRYTDGDHTLIVVPGRDPVEGRPDPAAYQKDKERELEPYRSSTWVTSKGIRTTTVGQQLIAEGQYTWIDGNGRSVYARNYVVALGGRYHVVMVTGPQDHESKVSEIFEKATGSYRPGG